MSSVTDGSFYITLPSNTGSAYQPNNRTSNFTIQLPERIQLGQYWKVGLVNFIYANSYSKDEGAYTVYVDIPLHFSGHFHLSTKHSTSGAIFQAIHDAIVTLTATKGITISDYLVLENKDGKTNITLRQNTKLGFSIPLAIALGFLTADLSFRKYEFIEGRKGHRSRLAYGRLELAERVSGTAWYSTNHKVNMDELSQYKPNDMYVYTDIVEGHPVGNTNASLLRLVPVNEKESVVNQDFTNPMYFSVGQTFFSSISILITDDTGKEIPFAESVVQVTLHFKRSRLPY